jgi:hypothetical protein
LKDSRNTHLIANFGFLGKVGIEGFVMAYVALLELVGVRSLAVDEPIEYGQRTKDFYNGIYNSLSTRKDFDIYFFRDHCYAEHRSIKSLIAFLHALQSELLQRHSLLIRGALAEGDLESKKLEVTLEGKNTKGVVVGSNTLNGFRFDALSSELFGMQERLKGVGVNVSSKLVKKHENLVAKGTIFENVYVTNRTTNRYEGFWDIALHKDMFSTANLSRIIHQMMHARVFSKKIARFYVPVLVNWILHQELSDDPSPVSELRQNLKLDERIAAGSLASVRDIIGVDVVYLALLNRVYSKDNKLNEERVLCARTHLKGRSWLIKLLQKEDMSTILPDNIISSKSIRAFAKDLGAY